MSIFRVLIRKYEVYQGREKREMQLEIYQYLNENKAVVASYSFNQSYKKGLKRPWVFVQELVDGFKVRSDLKDLVMLSVFE